MRENWKYQPLGEICDILDSKRKPITKNKRVSGSIPYYGATGVLGYVKDYIFDEKLVLLGEDGAKWGAGENSSYIICGKSWVNNHAHALKPHRNIILDEFLVYYLNYSDLSESITGVTVPKLNQEKMRAIIIPVPPLTEQERIVALLDDQFAKIDTLKANADQQLKAAKDLFQSALKEVFEANRNWKYKSFEDCLQKVPKQKAVKSKDYLENGMFPIVSQESDLISGYTDDENILYKHENPVIIFGDHTKNIKYIDFNFVVGADGVHILSVKDDILPKFFYYELCSIKLRNLGYARHYKLLKEKEIGYPKLTEQERIAARLDAISEKVKALQANYDQTINLCNDLKQSLLKSIFE